jgi:long-chain acyl-CoA synthetase
LLGEETQAIFQMIGIPVYQVYGLTETTAIVSIDKPDAVRLGHVGYPVQGCDVRISGEGELLCRGPNIFAGYWRKPGATAEVLKDGWFHTGDQVERDANGNLRIIGRLKDLVIPESGHNVAPAKIEQRLLDVCPGIQQAVVVGHGRPFLTAIVTGAVAPDELNPAIEQVNGGVPHYMRVRKVYRASEPFSVENGLLTANQKLRRGAIEAHYRAAIEELYA